MAFKKTADIMCCFVYMPLCNLHGFSFRRALLANNETLVRPLLLINRTFLSGG